MSANPRWPIFVGTWKYQSFLVLPTDIESAAAPGSPVAAKKWANGTLEVNDSVGLSVLGRTLTFQPGVTLIVDLEFEGDRVGQPLNVRGTGTGKSGALKGAQYELTGWALVDRNNDALVTSISGAIRAVRGTDANPGEDPGGMPIPTVGFFTLTR